MNEKFEPRFGGHPYAFSIVMAVYNVAPFLAEAVDSILQQTFGWKYTQIILVDDGSTDESPALCDAYQQKYPDNILAIHKQNGGVSSARNEGLKHVRGQYVNFTDPDDKLSPNTLTDVYDFFERFKDETDIVCFPMRFFDAVDQPHIQNFKIKPERRVVDLLEEWEFPHASTCSSFIRSEIAVSFTFDTRVTYGEDACYINKIMLDKCTIGTLPTCLYLYRKRNDGSSALQNSTHRNSWYLPSVHYFMEELLRYAQEKKGFVPLFTQYNIMYDLQWRLNQQKIPDGVLSPEELKEYKETIRHILEQMDDEVITTQRFMEKHAKFHALACKRSQPPTAIRKGQNLQYVYTIPEGFLSEDPELSLIHLDVANDQCTLDGYFSVPPDVPDPVSLILKNNSLVYPFSLESAQPLYRCMNDPICKSYRISCTFPLRGDRPNRIFISLLQEDELSASMPIGFQAVFPVSRNCQRDYCPVGGYTVSHAGAQIILNRRDMMQERTLNRLLDQEIRYSESLGGYSAYLNRKKIRLYQRMHREETWIIHGGSDPADARLLALIDRLHAEKPQARLYAVFQTALPGTDRIGAAEVIGRDDQPRYSMIFMSCAGICCAVNDFNRITPFGRFFGVYRSLLRHPEYRVIDDTFSVTETYRTSAPAPIGKGAALKSIIRAAANHPLALKLRTKAVRLIHRLPQKYVLLESVPAYGDNTGAVYRYIRENGLLKEYKIYWLLQDAKEKQEGIPSIVPGGSLLNRLRYKMILARSIAIVCGNKIHPKVREDQLLINLGHGSCLKSVFGYYSMPGYMDYILIQAPAFETATRYEHRVNVNTVITALGYPRNDDFYGPPAADPHSLFAQDFRRLIVWYPTFRQHKNAHIDMSSITLPLLHDEAAARAINDCARENRVLLVLKPHFAQDTSYIRDLKLSNILFIDDSFFAQHHIRPYQFLHLSDAMLTDYSSVYYDYLLQNKPIGMIWEDIAEYNHGKNFAVDTDVFCAGAEKLYTVEDLCGFIARVAQNIDPLKDQRTRARDLTNYAADGKNAERTALWLQEIIRAYPEKLQLGKTQY